MMASSLQLKHCTVYRAKLYFNNHILSLELLHLVTTSYYRFKGGFVTRDPHGHLALPERVQASGDRGLQQECAFLSEGLLELHILGRLSIQSAFVFSPSIGPLYM